MNDTMSIYFSKGRKRLKSRLDQLATKKDRSVNLNRPGFSGG